MQPRGEIDLTDEIKQQRIMHVVGQRVERVAGAGLGSEPLIWGLSGSCCERALCVLSCRAFVSAREGTA